MDRVIQEIKNTYHDIDRMIGSIPNVCSKGCSYCCYQSIKIVASEELTISEYLDKNVDDDKKQIIKSQLETWTEYFFENTPDNKVLNDEDILKFEERVVRDSIPCFFLIEGKCSIYPVRPLVCRTHIVADNPEFCNKDRTRNSLPNTYTIREQAMTRIFKSAPMNSIRLLGYAMSDYFEIKIPLKLVALRLIGRKY
jgi:Fe-S-cluster containining protein